MFEAPPSIKISDNNKIIIDRITLKPKQILEITSIKILSVKVPKITGKIREYADLD